MFYAAATPGWVANGNYTGEGKGVGTGERRRGKTGLSCVRLIVWCIPLLSRTLKSAAGWIILDKDDPTTIVQRSEEHIMMPLLPYEQVRERLLHAF